MIRNGLALLAGAGDHHFVIHKIFAIGVRHQEIRAMNVARVDSRHDEGGDPHVIPINLS